MEAKRFLVAVVVLAVAMLAVPPLAVAITYTVVRADDIGGACPSAGNCSLRQAINSANAQPLAGATVAFTVSGAVDTTGQCTTDPTGRCSFTYDGPNVPGADVIRAYADANGKGVQDAGEIDGVATKEWLLPASTRGQVTEGGRAPRSTAGSSSASTCSPRTTRSRATAT